MNRHEDNRRRLVESYEKGEAVSRGFPIMLAIESTNRCNMRCVMCPRSEMTRATGNMDVALLNDILDEARGLTEFAYLHLFGEPLLHPDLAALIEAAAARGVHTGVSTNAALLGPEKRRLLLDSPLDLLIVCLDGATKTSYERIRQGASFEQVLENVNGLVADCEKDARPIPRVVVQMVQLDMNREDREAFGSLWPASRRIRFRMKAASNWAGQVAGINELVGDTVQQPGAGGRCVEPWRSLVIYWNGDAVPCCNDFDGAVSLGNVGLDGVAGVWNGPRMVDLRERMVRGAGNLPRLCRGCQGLVPSGQDLLGEGSPFYPFPYEVSAYWGTEADRFTVSGCGGAE